MKKILLAEDSPVDTALMRRAFHERTAEFQLMVVDTVASARAMLEQDRPDLLIVDFMLPDGNGTELIPVAQTHDCPAIVLTGQGSEEIAVKVLRSGALDYLVKSPEQLADMPHAANRALRQWLNARERERNRRLLAESEERFRTFAELAADWFWETDPALHLTLLSEGFQRISSLAAENFIGKPLRALGDPQDGAVDWHSTETLCHQRMPFELEIPLAGREMLTLYLRGKPFFDGQQNFRGYRGIGRDITRERQALQEITYLAMHDPLTNALNRRSLEMELKTALLGVVRHGETHAFCFFDLDHFKEVNDTAGHLAGDRILQEVVATITRNIRAGDSLGRLGGDEFGVLLKHCSRAKAEEITRTIVASVAKRKLEMAGQSVGVTVSAGVVALRADHDITQVYRDADLACYESKHAGGDQVSGTEQSMDRYSDG